MIKQEKVKELLKVSGIEKQLVKMVDRVVTEVLFSTKKVKKRDEYLKNHFPETYNLIVKEREKARELIKEEIEKVTINEFVILLSESSEEEVDKMIAVTVQLSKFGQIAFKEITPTLISLLSKEGKRIGKKCTSELFDEMLRRGMKKPREEIVQRDPLPGYT